MRKQTARINWIWQNDHCYSGSGAYNLLGLPATEPCHLGASLWRSVHVFPGIRQQGSKSLSSSAERFPLVVTDEVKSKKISLRWSWSDHMGFGSFWEFHSAEQPLSTSVCFAPQKWLLHRNLLLPQKQMEHLLLGLPTFLPVVTCSQNPWGKCSF